MFKLFVECSSLKFGPLAQRVGEVFEVHEHMPAEGRARLLLAEATVVESGGAKHDYAHVCVRILIFRSKDTLTHLVSESPVADMLNGFEAYVSGRVDKQVIAVSECLQRCGRELSRLGCTLLAVVGGGGRQVGYDDSTGESQRQA